MFTASAVTSLAGLAFLPNFLTTVLLVHIVNQKQLYFLLA
jgi:hypothetical protein